MSEPAAAVSPLYSNLVLIGLRGSGKTTTGQWVAQRLGWAFVDLDARIEARLGKTVREIFAEAGESAFRREEATEIAAVVQGRQQVIATGGGAVLEAENRQKLKAAGLCIWLTAPVEVLAERLAQDRRTPALRPALTELAPLDELRQLAAEREPLYAATAHAQVDTAKYTQEQVVQQIVRQINPSSARGAAEGRRP